MSDVFMQPYPTRESLEALSEYNDALIVCSKRACEDPSFWTDEVEDELETLMVWNIKKLKGYIGNDVPPPRVSCLDFDNRAVCRG